MDGLQQDPVGYRKIKQSEVAKVRDELLAMQEGVCPLCNTDIQPGQATLDHNHEKTTESAGAVRDVLCRNCNGIEGRIRNLVIRGRRGMPFQDYLKRISEYWTRHSVNQHGLIHYKHKEPKKKKK